MKKVLALIFIASITLGGIANAASNKWQHGQKYQLKKAANEINGEKCVQSFLLWVGIRANGEIDGPIGKSPGAADHIFFVDVNDSRSILKQFDFGFKQQDVNSGMLSGTITQSTTFDGSELIRVIESGWYPKEICKDQCNSKGTESIKYDSNSNLIYRWEKMSCVYRRF